jgi:hypothetical protein
MSTLPTPKTPDFAQAIEAGFKLHDEWNEGNMRRSSADPLTKLDALLPIQSMARNLIERGQSFGFLNSNFDFDFGIQIEKMSNKNFGLPQSVQYQFDSLSIKISGRKFSIDLNSPSGLLTVYRERNSGSYFIGSLFDNHFSCHSESNIGLDDNQLCNEIYKWGNEYATKFPEKRSSFIDIFSDKPMPSRVKAGDIAKAAFTELVAYINRTLC